MPWRSLETKSIRKSKVKICCLIRNIECLLLSCSVSCQSVADEELLIKYRGKRSLYFQRCDVQARRSSIGRNARRNHAHQPQDIVVAAINNTGNSTITRDINRNTVKVTAIWTKTKNCRVIWISCAEHVCYSQNARHAWGERDVNWIGSIEAPSIACSKNTCLGINRNCPRLCVESRYSDNHRKR